MKTWHVIDIGGGHLFTTSARPNDHSLVVWTVRARTAAAAEEALGDILATTPHDDSPTPT